MNILDGEKEQRVHNVGQMYANKMLLSRRELQVGFKQIGYISDIGFITFVPIFQSQIWISFSKENWYPYVLKPEMDTNHT